MCTIISNDEICLRSRNHFFADLFLFPIFGPFEEVFKMQCTVTLCMWLYSADVPSFCNISCITYIISRRFAKFKLFFLFFFKCHLPFADDISALGNNNKVTD